MFGCNGWDPRQTLHHAHTHQASKLFFEDCREMLVASQHALGILAVAGINLL
jgi:hypothetical protein